MQGQQCDDANQRGQRPVAPRRRGGREGAEYDGAKDVRVALDRFREAMNTLTTYCKERGIAIRFALEGGYPPLLMAGGRFIVAGGLMYAALRLRGVPPPTRAQYATTA